MRPTGTIAVLAAALALGGCASTALHSYLGHDVRTIARRYGPPAAQSSMPDGTESFDWVVAARRTPATAAPLNAFLPVDTAPLSKRSAAARAGLLLGGMCVYTVFARPDRDNGSWKVVGYRQPRIDCD